MKVVIRFTQKQEKLALPILLRHSPGMILPERTYILAAEAIDALRAAGIQFREISRETHTATAEGDSSGERI